MKNFRGLVIIVGCVALAMLAVLLTYALAREGNPEALWLWRDVGGVHFR